MKFISKILNFFTWIITFCLFSLLTIGVWDYGAMYVGSNNISIYSNKEDKVSYVDAFAFWGNDIKASVTREPRYMVRAWSGAEWWQNGTKWADYAIEAVVGAVVPVFAPTYEVSQLKDFYVSNNDQSDLTITISKEYSYSEDLYGVKFDSTVSSAAELKSEYTGKSDMSTWVVYEYRESAEDTSASGHLCKVVVKDGVADVQVAKEQYSTSDSMGIGDWKKYNKSFVNKLYKIDKYNNPDYAKWASKFLTEDKSEVKYSVVGVYSCFLISLILSIWFVAQNPIRIRRSGDGYDEVSGGFRNPFAVKTDQQREAEYEAHKWRRHFGHKHDDSKNNPK
jgi:hypothetical protein